MSEYSKECIMFAEVVSDMMAKRRRAEKILKARKRNPMHGKHNDDDGFAAWYEMRKAEQDVQEWISDILGLEEVIV